MPQAAKTLTERYALSLRQAYRYLEEAQQMEHPMPVTEASIPMTIKIPADVAQVLRKFARTSGLTIGEIVARSVRDFLDREGGRG